ncbi:MAG TPA: zinc ABC transporter substrate-binding protein, partial [Gemmataceae bacterium]|nr:zinc ABC transporter substrate-binding protein [Gemmataceae bacterium]
MRLLSAILAGLLLLPLAGCGPADRQLAPADLSQRPIRVVTTVGMITDLVENVGGDRVEVTGLMGPGVDPHLYKASEGDVIRLAGADVVFYNGLHLEARMGKVFERMRGRVRAVAVTDQIPRDRLRDWEEEAEGQYDPHVWFDVTLWMKAVEQVRDTLI